jgi:hypothetical protein
MVIVKYGKTKVSLVTLENQAFDMITFLKFHPTTWRNTVHLTMPGDYFLFP